MHEYRGADKGSGHKWISLDAADEVMEWIRELKCTESDLRVAVKVVGNSPVAVRNFLAKRTETQN